ncbi:unnamed protein product [Didymodactylos carnosus]|uniref:Uncharacterized protein n=1 Tax=Didymodactylos carnosus TaxID=1234261 RepID=A0A814EWQ3_9BILA|nr:unnamed protein product [Didymodactylos carnosus]CAF3747842.1 unnamed protein product [Didymodactylos carnosus]
MALQTFEAQAFDEATIKYRESTVIETSIQYITNLKPTTDHNHAIKVYIYDKTTFVITLILIVIIIGLILLAIALFACYFLLNRCHQRLYNQTDRCYSSLCLSDDEEEANEKLTDVIYSKDCSTPISIRKCNSQQIENEKYKTTNIDCNCICTIHNKKDKSGKLLTSHCHQETNKHFKMPIRNNNKNELISSIYSSDQTMTDVIHNSSDYTCKETNPIQYHHHSTNQNSLVNFKTNIATTNSFIPYPNTSEDSLENTYN